MKITNKSEITSIQTVKVNKNNNENDNQQKAESDSLSISDESRKLFDESEQYISMLRKQLEDSNNQESPFEDISKYFEIARRIMNGDKVPPKDVQKLMEAYPELYKMAEMLKKENRNPEKYDSLFEDDDKGKETETEEIESSDE